MLINGQIKQLYSQIQNDLIKLIPEKWEKIYLYASFPEGNIEKQGSEMFFYYFPKSILKRNPINAYEIPKRFHIIEEDYLELIKLLYEQLKSLREEFILSNEKLWTNFTIKIENTKFSVIYNYEDLTNTKFDSYERHIIWKYKFLNDDFESYTKNEKLVLQRYFDMALFNVDELQEEVYEDNIYLDSNIRRLNGIKEEYIRELNIVKPKEKKIDKKKEKEEIEKNIEENKKSQILSTNIF